MNEIFNCDFCGKEITEVKKMFSSEDAHICDECITMCSKVLEKEEQCNTCLIPTNSTELESTKSDFLVGDVVVLTDYCTSFKSNDLFTQNN